MDLLPLLKDFGFPVALCGVLLLAVRHMFTTYDRAQKARIGAIEAALAEEQARSRQTTTDAAKRADEYSAVLQGLLSRHEASLAAHNNLTRQTLDILRRLVDALAARPCLVEDYRPHSAAPSPDARPSVPPRREVPMDPVTERTTGRA